MAVNPVSALPRYMALKGQNGKYLTLQSDGLLSFVSSEITRLATHEVLYNSDDANATFIIRSQNQYYWERDSSDFGWIRATRDPSDPPSLSETAARFKFGLSSDKPVFQSAAEDGLYLKRLNTEGTEGYAAYIASPDAYTYVEVIDAWETAVSLPRYIFIKGDNDYFMQSHWEGETFWLKFKGSDNGDLYGTNEVIPLLDGTIALHNGHALQCWRNSTNWIWVDTQRNNAASNERCHFEPVKLGSTILALRSKYNSLFCKRLTYDNWTDCLNAAEEGTTSKYSHLTISEAANSKSVFDVKYLLNLASTTDQEPIAAAYGSNVNNSSYTSDMTVSVIRATEVSNSYVFSNSFTFSETVTTSFKTGIPFLARGEIDVQVGAEQNWSNQWGETTTESVEIAASYLVKDVPPGGQATVQIMCSTATMRIPFTYTSKEVAPDGTDRPSEECVDGIFEGVNAYKVEGTISNGVTTYTEDLTPESPYSFLKPTN